MNLQPFQRTIRNYFKKEGRDLEWRHTSDPYRIMVSEVMLQQTQVARVAVKYPEFIQRFPDIGSLARAQLKDIYAVWQGMGYNRRALYLKKAAEIIVRERGGRVPDEPALLEKLPGIGYATARSIVVFAHNKPQVFIETNIRRVYLHFFFAGKTGVHDKEILPLVDKTLDRDNPREWYYALMDYGVMLAKTEGNANRRSRHYTKQSKFEGSNRQVRAAVLRAVAAKPQSMDQLGRVLPFDFAAISKNIDALVREGFIKSKNNVFHIQ